MWSNAETLNKKTTTPWMKKLLSTLQVDKERRVHPHHVEDMRTHRDPPKHYEQWLSRCHLHELATADQFEREAKIAKQHIDYFKNWCHVCIANRKKPDEPIRVFHPYGGEVNPIVMARSLEPTEILVVDRDARVKYQLESMNFPNITVKQQELDIHTEEGREEIKKLIRAFNPHIILISPACQGYWHSR